jgi:cyclomaltodextrin glucanotransferase
MRSNITNFFNPKIETKMRYTIFFFVVSLIGCSAHSNQDSLLIETPRAGLTLTEEKSYLGTNLPFASEAVYFLMTDRFDDGDPSNNFESQGGEFGTFRRPLLSKDGKEAFVGYMGGDFKGILNNAAYISEMGFTSIWLTPIVDQPDQAFSGGQPITFGGAFKDGGKTGYHGYWGDNFYQVDEHLPSADLSFKQLTHQLKEKYKIKTVLDIVLNHGSPAFSMPVKQQKFGQIFDKNWNLVADHDNLAPEELDQGNPLHKFYNQRTEIVQLSDINENNPAVMDYFVNAYLQWIDQGADAFRIDTIKHMPHSFWKSFTDRIRSVYPDYFMFAESYSFDAKFIAQHTFAKNGGVSVLDFPGRQAIISTFENPNSNYQDITNYLHLTDNTYQNPYELMTFYDNHDMARMNANENGFIDAHNWLFTSRGIPVIYYGSEIGFMAGAKEHAGNRNYLGKKNIAKATHNKIRKQLSLIANLRKHSVALQKGIQINLEFDKNKASFYRIYQHQGIYQTALVLLNKGDKPALFRDIDYLSYGTWTLANSNITVDVRDASGPSLSVDPHSVKVLFFGQPINNTDLIKLLD